MAVGSVKWFDEAQGVGPIAHEDGEDVGVYDSAIAGSGFKTLVAGEQVEFDLTHGPRGPLAANVRRRP